MFENHLQTRSLTSSVHSADQHIGVEESRHSRRLVARAAALFASAFFAIVVTTAPVSAGSLPEHHLDKVFCAPTDAGGSIVVPPPVVYAMDYRQGVTDYQWVSWRAQLYKHVGTSWETVGTPTVWQPNQLVHDKDIAERYIFSANTATFAFDVARGANYRVAIQVYWLSGGRNSTVPVAASGPWWTASAHMNNSGWGWFQWNPDLCRYPVTSGVINL